MKCQNKFHFALVFTFSVLLCIVSCRQEDTDTKRSAHNILRFGRSGFSSSAYPFRVNRAGHNIMRFGRSDRTLAPSGPEGDTTSEILSDASPQPLTIAEIEALNELPDLLVNGYTKSKRNRNNFIHFG